MSDKTNNLSSKVQANFGPNETSLGRRDFLKKSALTVAGATLAGSLLAACGDNTATPAAAPAGTSVTSAAGAASSGAASGEPIKVGVLITFTGPYTQIGNDVYDAINLYFSSIGNQVGGRPIKVFKEDEGSSPDNTLQRAKKLIDQDKVDFIAGIALTNDYLAIRDYIDSNKTILIVANAGSNSLVQDKFSKYIFRSSFGNGQYTYPLGVLAAQNFGKTAVASAPDYAAGREQVAGFTAGFTKSGGTVLKELFSVLGQTTDYAPFLTQVQDAKPQVTYAFYSGADTINWIKQYDQFGLKKNIPLVGNFAIDNNSLSQMGDAAEGVIYSTIWADTLDNPLNKKYVADFKAKYNRDVGSASIYGYDAAQMIVGALKATNGDTSDKAKLAAAMENLKLESPRGPISINPNNHGLVQNVYEFQITKGSDGKLFPKLYKTFQNVPEIADLLKNGLPGA